jgi:4-hydroxy-3-polyprenylbenzoate decarboxylase
MERAREIWEQKLGLPKLKPEVPWFGYSLGDWADSLDVEAERAVRGDYWDNGRLSAQRRRNDVAMNSDVSRVDESK